MGLERVRKSLESDMQLKLQQSGLFYRIFSREKSKESAERKIDNKNYKITGKKITDIIGLRIMLYFADDVDAVRGYLKRKFFQVEEVYDKPEKDVFGPVRLNILFKIPEDLEKEFKAIMKLEFCEYSDIIESCFEVQIRTILSEGWHEIEHDLRYKRINDWAGHDDISRLLNGVYATLTTSEWSMIEMFNKLSYLYYKEKKWESMLWHKFRLRFNSNKLSTELSELFDNDNEFAKKVYRLEREEAIKVFLDLGVSLPFNINNFIYILNEKLNLSDSLSIHVPVLIKEKLNSP
ncbi:hypothetical protein EPN96_09450 [bacterium]|nr:MAG: hypothetical protein EPN96_09450 [bacterium]